YLEVMGYSDHLITSEIWYRLLNCGFHLPAAAGTDAFPNFTSLRGPPGLVRVFVHAGMTLDHRLWLAALKAGQTFVTNAPLLDLYPFGSTSPIYVRVDDRPALSPGDAAFFVRWIERLEQVTRASAAWNTAEEQTSVLRSLAEAKGVFQEQPRQ